MIQDEPHDVDLGETIEHASSTGTEQPEGRSLLKTIGSFRPLNAVRAFYFNGCGFTAWTRFMQYGKMEDLENSIMYHSQALELRPPGTSSRFVSLNNLALALQERFQQRGDIEDLNKTIGYSSEALSLIPQNHTHRLKLLNNLGTTLQTRFLESGVTSDLERAIELYSEALDQRPIGHPERTLPLGNLADAVHKRFEHLGKVDDLEKSISYNLNALSLCPPGHPNRSTALNNLTLALGTQFTQFGKIEDLEKAITHTTEALSLRPSGHPERFMSLNALALLTRLHFHEGGNMEDLGRAIKYHEESLSLCVPGHIGRCNALAGLGVSLGDWYKQKGDLQVLERSIQCHSEALALRSPGHSNRPEALNNLATSLFDRFDRTGQENDLYDAARYVSDAEKTLPPGHPTHTVLRSNLALFTLKQYQIDPEKYPLAAVFELYAASANHSTGSIKLRLGAAVRWTKQAHRYHHESIFQAHSIAMNLLQRHVLTEPTVERRQKALAKVEVASKSLALDAASMAIATGQLEAAVEFLEQGRAILWTTLRGYRHPLDQLAQVDQELADEFKRLSHQLEHRAVLSEHNFCKLSWAVEVSQIARQISISEEWDKVVEKIRATDGFSNFLKAVPFDDLCIAAVGGPIVIVNISQYRCDALIVRDVGPPILIPLPEVSSEMITRLSSRFVDARASSAFDFSKNLSPVLRTLWKTIVSPVTQQLPDLGVAKRSRIWWCPTAELCALPLHAAGPYTPRNKNLPDLYISSYTPTLAALVTARHDTRSTTGFPKLLLVGQPGESLPQVREEVRRIQNLGPFVKPLLGHEATQAAVIANFRIQQWVHFACHGHRHPEPFHSSFELYGGNRLKLLDLIGAHVPDAQLAFLSACHGAAGDIVGTPDEIIHLAAALQFCGFKSIVGTLWAMADEDGPDISEDFYKYMFRDSENVDIRDAATAINLATKSMRKREGMTLGRWVNFIHIGV